MIDILKHTLPYTAIQEYVKAGSEKGGIILRYN